MITIPYKIILGSSSPRRKSLLSGLGIEFTCAATDIAEDYSQELIKQEIPIYLAKEKAKAYHHLLIKNELYITADTIVWLNNKVFNKPQNYAEGFVMLNELSEQTHKVYTAVCLTSIEKQICICEESKVTFKKLQPQEIDYYLNNYKPYDKAGSYGVQDWLGYIGIEKIEGCYYNVMGFPIKQVWEALINF